MAGQTFIQNFGDGNVTGASPTAHKEIFFSIFSEDSSQADPPDNFLMFYYFMDMLVTQQSGQITCYVAHITLSLPLIPHMKISLPIYWPLLITRVHS